MSFGVLAVPAWADPATYYVDKNNGNNYNPDGSPDKPFKTIRAALDGAEDGDTFIVIGGEGEKGIYKENTIPIHKSITLKSSGRVTLDGSDKNRVILIISAASPTIEGFTIAHGNDASGGGIFVNANCGVTVTNCVFDSNNASTGGGLWVDEEAGKDITLTNCTFVRNSAIDGGGIRTYGLADVTTTLTNCTFTGNTAQNGGGAWLGGYNTNGPTVTNCTFVNNTAKVGNEIFVAGDITKLTLTNSLIWTTSGNHSIGFNEKSYALDHCAAQQAVIDAAADKTECVTVPDWSSPATDTPAEGSPAHTVFNVEKNPSLIVVIGRGKADGAPEVDQLGHRRDDGKPDIGAVEYRGTVTLVSSTKTDISGKVGEELNKTVTFTPSPALDYVWNVDASKVTDKNITVASDSKNEKNFTLTLTGKPSTTGKYTITVTGETDQGNWPLNIDLTLTVNKAAPVVPDPEPDSEPEPMPTPTPTPTPAPPAIAVAITPDSATLSLRAGGDAAAASFSATGTVTYPDGTTKNVVPVLTLESEHDWINIDGGTITARTGLDVPDGEYTATLLATATADGGTGTATAKITVRVIGFSLGVVTYDTELGYMNGYWTAHDLKDNVFIRLRYADGTEVPYTGDRTLAFEKDGDWPDKLTLTEDGVAEADLRDGSKLFDTSMRYRVTATALGRTAIGTGKLEISERNNPPYFHADPYADNPLDVAKSGKKYYCDLRSYTEAGDSGINLDNIIYELTDGSLPLGLQLLENGIIFGWPKLSTRGNTYRFRVKLSAPSIHGNVIEADHPVEAWFTIRVKGVPPSSWKVTCDEEEVKKGKTFNVTYKVTNGTNVEYKWLTRPSSKNPTLLKDMQPAEGGGLTFKCKWPTTSLNTYVFKVKAFNDEGESTYHNIAHITISGKDKGKITITSGTESKSSAAITADDGAEGPDYVESVDGETVNGKVYFDNGGVDGDGNITAVVGDAAEGAEGAEYVYATVDAMLAALSDRLDKVIALEFRSGSAFDANAIKKLPNLEELSIDETDVTALDLSGDTTLESLSLYGCEKLTSLNVNGCTSLKSLSVEGSANLAALDVSGCNALESVTVTGAAISTLDLSDRATLANVNVSGCAGLKALNVSGGDGQNAPAPHKETGFASPATYLTRLEANGCTSLASLNVAGRESLTDVELDGTRLTALDLGACKGLKSLSLADATELTSLVLPNSPVLEDFKLTGSKVPELNLSGIVSADELNLSDNAQLVTLDVSGNALARLDLFGIKTLDMVDCGGQTISGVPMDRRLNLNDYVGSLTFRVSDVQGYDADGAEIGTTWNEKTGIATFASVPATVEYLYDTGLRDIAMDVTLTLNGEPTGPEGDGGSAHGGCDAGPGLGVLALAALALVRRKR